MSEILPGGNQEWGSLPPNIFIRYLLFFVMTYFSYEKNTSDDAAVSKSSFLYWQDLLYIPLLPSKFIFLYFAVVAHHACV